jgi:hypothetical protein
MHDEQRPIGAFRVLVSKDLMEKITTELQSFFSAEHARKYSRSVVSNALRAWLDLRVDKFSEDLAEVLTTSGRPESREFQKILMESFSGVSESAPQSEEAESNVFTGFRPFSAERLGAMATYIATKGRDIYKTKLNKLLFYSDFINFYLHGHSISGTRYIHVPFGPVPEHYGDVLAHLADSGRVNLQQLGEGVLVTPTAEPAGELSPDEIETIDWVLANYGRMTSTEISNQSHQEKAYRFTRPGEEIAYRYAAFFGTLPDKE